MSNFTLPKTGRYSKGQVADVTVDKMLEVYNFLALQSEPVGRMDIQKAVGFNCVRHLVNDATGYKEDSVCLENMGLVRRTQVHARKVSWELYDKSPEGLEAGRQEIENLRGLP